MACRDPDQGRARNRERFRKRTADRRARGLCLRCGERPPAPGLSLCDPCGEKRRASERARARKRQAAGRKRLRNPASERAADFAPVPAAISNSVLTRLTPWQRMRRSRLRPR